jgi:hypothetical protein
MNRFAPALRRIARDLDLPRNARAAILLEMAADLEGIYQHHRRGGASEEEAIGRAEEMVLGSSDLVRRLARLHHRSWRGWSDSVGARLSGGPDLLMLVVGVAPMLLLAATVVVRALANPVSPLVWVLIGVGLAIAALVVVESGRLLGGGRGQARGLPVLLVLSAVAPAVGMLALVFGLYSVSMALATGIPDHAAQIALIVRIGQSAVLLLVGLLLGIAGFLSSFALLNRASALAAREVDILLGADPLPESGRRADGIIHVVRGGSA